MKRWIALVLALVMMSTVMLCMPLTASAESLYIRKIVSVVYDDSGSMAGDKWAFANYAMQSFCGMLNSEDQLYITYMSEVLYNSGYEPEQIDLSASGIQSSVDSIRRHYDSASTPFDAVETAYEKLKSVDDSNPNTQYWLVIITDGVFDECNYMTVNEATNYLNDSLADYRKETMPNGTKPQLTFLGIGDDAVLPDADTANGLYTYFADDDDEIIDAMSEMADKISGRTRLDESDVTNLDDRTLQVQSTIPLLNIAVFVQGDEAKVTGANYANEMDIPITRNVSLFYPSDDDSDLAGGAFLLGDSQRAIGSGSYTITFDREVEPEDVIVLFEPALEMRMTISVNGKELTDRSELKDTMEGDTVSVSCKIYEMGTDTEIDPSLLPNGTTFEVTVSEDGTVVDRVSGEALELTDYTLNNVETKITAAVRIEGFNPIEYTAKFTPAEYSSRVSYSLIPSFGSDAQSVSIKNIAANTELTVCFTVLADGEAVTDPALVKALAPTVTASPQGNGGSVTYADDGRIVFTPNAASLPAAAVDSFAVDVTCTLADGTTATESYTVLTADYQIIPTDGERAVKKNELYANDVSVSFYITKDGVRLNKSEVENGAAILLNEAHRTLTTTVTVDADGTITVTPFSTEPHEVNFKTWWTNWLYYFGLSGEDIVVTLSHPYGSASASIEVVEAELRYRILNVYLPLTLEILLLAAIIAYIIRYATKARFAANVSLYVGYIDIRKSGNVTHRLNLREIRLKQYNKFKNLWNPFKELTVSAGGVCITAAKGSRILCNEPFPWYSDEVRPVRRTIRIETPADVVNYCNQYDELEIKEIRCTTVMDEQNPTIMLDDTVYYFVRADEGMVGRGAAGRRVIESATAFCYSISQT